MTHFEQTYLRNRPSSIFISHNSKESDTYDLTSTIQKQRQDIEMQLQYRELDRLSLELEKEIKAAKALRIEMEKYKVNFNLTVEDEATKKIQEVIDSIDKMFK